MANHANKLWYERLGSLLSSWVADVAAHPFAQLGVILICALWWLVGLPTDILTATLSILAITLTQMVLNRQNEREIDDHRRDVAMHAKLDELIAVTRQARNDFVAVEERDEEEIVQLKEEVKEKIEESTDVAGPEVRETARRAVDAATKDLKSRPGEGRNGQRPRATAGKRSARR